MTRPIEQRRPDLVFQLLDGLAYGRLRRKDGLGGLGEATLPYDLDECAKRSEFHGYSISE
jgi:hypothetical protein